MYLFEQGNEQWGSCWHRSEWRPKRKSRVCRWVFHGWRACQLSFHCAFLFFWKWVKYRIKCINLFCHSKSFCHTIVFHIFKQMQTEPMSCMKVVEVLYMKKDDTNENIKYYHHNTYKKKNFIYPYFGQIASVLCW